MGGGEPRLDAHRSEIFFRLPIAEALALSEEGFNSYIRHGCRLPIDEAPLRSQLRALRDELRFYRGLRCP